jgi:hypothetical protein
MTKKLPKRDMGYNYDASASRVVGARKSGPVNNKFA